MRKSYLIVLFYFFALPIAVRAQHPMLKAFYDTASIQEIRIRFDFNDWDNRLDTARNGQDGYVLAAEVKVNGVLFDSVGVKYKGFSSFDPFNTKNPLNIELDHYKKQSYYGKSDIKLSNMVFDPSLVREVMAYSIAQNYMDCPRSNFVRVYINNVYHGLYTNVEPINKDFCAERFYSDEQPFFKCGAPIRGVFETATLEYLGPQTFFYTNSYEMKSDAGWSDLINLTNYLTSKPDKIDEVLDIDRTLWMLAFNNVFVNLDSYTGKFCQNYYLYKDLNGRFVPILWDLNMSFGAFGIKEQTPFQVYTLTELRNFSPDAEFTNDRRPLIKQLMTNPTYRKMYYAHMRTMNSEFLLNNAYIQMANRLRSTIDSSTKADNNGFIDYATFQSGLSSSIEFNGLFIPGITALIPGRRTFLNTYPSISAAAPTITNPYSLNTLPEQSDQFG